MMIQSPRSHVWLDVPTACRFEASVMSADEVRMVIGHPLEDGHTIEWSREALRRFHAVTSETLKSIDDGSWMNATSPRISEPAQDAAEPSTNDRPTDPEAPLAG